MRLPDVVASFDGITPHVYRLSHLLLLIPYLATKDVKLTCYVALLCLRLRLSSALHLLHHCRLPLFGYYPPNILTARCLLAAYPGIQQMVLFPPLYHTPFTAPFAMSCPFC